MPKAKSDTGADLSALRRKITELVAQNAVAMVQNAIDAVNEEGQYQAIKYLFEMIGLHPATANNESQAQESLARTLLDQLGRPNRVTGESEEAKRSSRHPVE
jgi:hypothetical protein